MKDNEFHSISPTEFTEFNNIINEMNVETICNSGLCPNRPECFGKKQLTFLILGNTCTRSCKYCNIDHGNPESPDPGEPKRIAKAVRKLGLKYVVLTSVTRDDLNDGGALFFVKTVKETRKLNPSINIELLIPDFKNNKNAIEKVISSKPQVINHNIECCRNIFKTLRPGADYDNSLELLRFIKESSYDIKTKSGFMVGIGESWNNIKQTLKDLKNNKVDIITIGQYLPPNKNSFPLKKEYTKKDFQRIEEYAKKIGIRSVYAGHKVRSSYNANEHVLIKH